MADARLPSVQAILRASREDRVRDPVPLVAAALEESGLNPNAHGDTSLGGTGSWGLFQLYTGGGMGTGHDPAQLRDPYYNAKLITKAWAGAGGRSLAGPGALLPYYQRVGRGADNAGAARKARALYAEAQRLVREAGGAAPAASIPPGATPGTQGNPGAPGVPGTAGSIDFSPTLMPSLTRYLNESQAAALAGRAQPALEPVLNLVTSGLSVMPGTPGIPATPATPAVPAAAPGAAATAGGNPFAAAVRGSHIGVPYKGTHTLGNWQSDNAVDIGVPVGTPVYAISSGTIGPRFGSLGTSGRFQGLRLTLQSPGDAFYYAHLSRYAPGIKPGAAVKAGQLLGFTGSANGVAHLHLGEEHGNPTRFFR